MILLLLCVIVWWSEGRIVGRWGDRRWRRGLDGCGCCAGNGLPLAPSAWLEKEEMGGCCGVTVEKESIGCCCGGEKFEGEKLALKP